MPDPAKYVLDLGCGRGGVGWQLQRERPSLHYTGVDADPRNVQRAYEGIRVHQFDLNLGTHQWHQQLWHEEGGYDCVILADVLEHLVDPWRTLKWVRPLLREGGLVVASIPNLRNVANLYELLVRGDFRYHKHGRDEWRGPHDNVLSWEHLRFFTQRTIARMFEGAGYRVLRWERSEMWVPPQLWNFLQELKRLAHSYPEGSDDTLTRDGLTIQHLVVAQPAEEDER